MAVVEEQRRNPSHQEENSEDSDNPESEIWYYKGKQVTGEPVAQNSKAWRQPHAHGASSSVDKESQIDTEATWDHYLHISTDTSHYMEVVFSMVRKIYGKQPGDLMKDLNVNLAIWWVFMNTTLRAAVHLGKDCEVILRCVKNHLWQTAGQLFRETEKLVRGQTETTGISMISVQDLRWVSTSLLHSRASQYLHCQSLRLLRLYALFWERWETILLNPGRGKFNGIRTAISFQRIESN